MRRGADRSGWTARPALRRRACGWRARRRAARNSWVCIFSTGTLRDSSSADRAAVAGRGDADHAADGDLLGHREVRDEVGHGLASLDAGQHHRASRPHVAQRLGDRRGGVRRHLDHDVGAAAVGELADALPHVLLIGDDGVVRAQLARHLQLRRVDGEPGDDDLGSARHPRRDHRREAALPGAEDEHGGRRDRCPAPRPPSGSRRPTG